MTEKTDVVVVGSGHNGLIAACYLARAGKKVLVLERRDIVGGGVVTLETSAPGYFHDLCSSFHVLIQANPLLLDDELGLRSKFGLAYVFPDAVLSTVFDDGDAIILFRDVERSCASIAAISPHDAEAYGALMKRALGGLSRGAAAMFAPPPPQGAFLAQLGQSPEGRAMMRTMQQSMLEVVDGLFESDKVKIHLLKIAAELLVAPREGGCGSYVANIAAFSHSYSWPVPLGGSRALTEALARCLAHFGGEIRTEADVTRITSSSGAVTGVELRDGPPIEAGLVIGQIHPWLLGEMVEGIAPELAQSARTTRTSSFSFLTNHFALREAARFRVSGDAGRSAYMSFVPSSLEDYLRVFDDLHDGALPESRILGVYDQAMWDPSRAPAGGGTLTLLGFGPYALRDGGSAAWDRRREELRSLLPGMLGERCENLTPDNIVGEAFHTPLDWERYSPTFRRGDVGGLSKALFQAGGHRPTPELSRYKVPGVDGLYLAGAAMHPSGGVTGGGRATAMQICGDLGIDFDALRSVPT